MDTDTDTALPAGSEEDEPHDVQYQPPAARSSFYGTLELYDEGAALLDDGPFA